ncbi:hypothetical protein AB4369_23290, partial [Vibrio sp. 10N.261.49.A5]|uniref:hypothetical protein n=1 Tax=Vibrio sp. 10N.261.49.A5 TaxID=3229670 RepID=UPI0035506E12
ITQQSPPKPVADKPAIVIIAAIFPRIPETARSTPYTAEFFTVNNTAGPGEKVAATQIVKNSK